MLLVAMVAWSATKKGPPPFLAGLKQNAYDDFIKAGNSLIGTFEDADDPKAFIRTNQPAFNAFRAGLPRRFEAPVETYDLQTFSALVMPKLALLKRLGQTIKAEGKLAEDSKNYTDAARIYLELIDFGQKIQAGPVIFLLVGLAVEDMGLKSLQSMENRLKEPDRAQIAQRLAKLAADRISFEEVMRRERYFGRRNSPTPFHYLISLRMTRAAIDKARSKYNTVVKSEKQLVEQLKEANRPK